MATPGTERRVSSRVFFVLVSVASVSLAQSWSPALALDAVSSGSSSGHQVTPVVVPVGGGYLALWDDDRDRQSHDVWMAPVDASGAPTTALSAPLLRLPGNQTGLAAAAGASTFLVAWLDDSLDACGLEVRAQVFTFAAAPVGSPQRLSMGACGADRPSVTFDGVSGQWLVVWGHHGTGREVHGAWVSSGGALAVTDFVIATGPNSAVNATAASLMGGSAVVAWADDRATFGVSNIFTAVVSSSGAVSLPSAVGASTTAQSTPCVAPLGTGALVGWVEGATGLFAQLVTSAGAVQGGLITVVSGGAGLSSVDCVAVGAGGPVALAWVDRAALQTSVVARTVTLAGLVSPAVTPLPQVSYFGRDLPRLASDGTTVVVVAQGDADYTSGRDVFARVMQATPDPVLVGAQALVDLSSNTAGHVNGAWDGERYFVTWRSEGLSGAGVDSVGRFLEATSGAWLGPDAGLRLSINSGNVVSYPTTAGAPDGGFFVEWGDDGSAGQLAGLLVSPSGATSSRLLLNDGFQYITTHVGRWFDDGWASLSLKNGAVHGRRTSRAGTTLMPETVLLTTGPAPEWLDAAALRDVLFGVLVVSDGGLGVHGVQWLADGGVLEVPIAVTTAAEVEPAVAASPNRFLVAWSQSADGGGLASRDVWATRVSPEGVVLDAPALSLGSSAEADLTPTVAWDGLNFVVSWARGLDLVAVRVSEQGAVLDASPSVLVNDGERAANPHAASGPFGEALITWEGFEPAAGAFRPRALLWFDAAGDAGTLADAGSVAREDAGAGALDDAGVQRARHYGVGCACGDASWLPLGLVVLLVLRRRVVRS